MDVDTSDLISDDGPSLSASQTPHPSIEVCERGALPDGANVQSEQNGELLVTYVDFARDVKVERGSRNINEFVPYTLVSWTKKLVELILVAIYHDRLVKPGSIVSQNGASFSGAPNIANGVTIAVASIALLVLVVRSLINVGRIQTLAATVVARRQLKGCDDNRETLTSIAATFVKDCRLKRWQGLHTLLLAISGLINGCAVVLTTFDGSPSSLKVVGMVSAFATVGLVITKNAADLYASFTKWRRCTKSLSFRTPMAIESRHHTTTRSSVHHGAMWRLKRTASVESFRCVSLALITTGFVFLLGALAGLRIVPIIAVLGVYLCCTIAGQGIALYMATARFTRRVMDAGGYGDIVLDDVIAVDDATFYRALQEALLSQESWAVELVWCLKRPHDSRPAGDQGREIEMKWVAGTVASTGCFDLCRNCLS